MPLVRWALSGLGFSFAHSCFVSLLSGFLYFRPYFKPHMIWSRGCLNFCQYLSWPHIPLGRFFIQSREICETCPRIWQTSVLVDIAIIVNTLFLRHIQIGVSAPGYTHVSGRGSVSSCGTQSWTRGSAWWRYMKSLCIDQKFLRASASSFASVGWGSSDSPWNYPLRSSLPTVCSRLRVGSRNS